VELARAPLTPYSLATRLIPAIHLPVGEVAGPLCGKIL